MKRKKRRGNPRFPLELSTVTVARKTLILRQLKYSDIEKRAAQTQLPLPARKIQTDAETGFANKGFTT